MHVLKASGKRCLMVLVLFFLLIVSGFFGCATSIKHKEFDTSNKRTVKAFQEYRYHISKPSPDDPYLKCRLLGVDRFTPEKEVQKNTIEEKRLVAPMQIILVPLIPLELLALIVTEGRVSIISKAKKVETVVDTSHRWVKDDRAKSVEKTRAINGASINVTYQHYGENRTIRRNTDNNGEVQFCLRDLARIVAMNPRAPDKIVFNFSSFRPHRFQEKINIFEDEFVRIFRKWNDDGYYDM